MVLAYMATTIEFNMVDNKIILASDQESVRHGLLVMATQKDLAEAIVKLITYLHDAPFQYDREVAFALNYRDVDSTQVTMNEIAKLARGNGGHTLVLDHRIIEEIYQRDAAVAREVVGMLNDKNALVVGVSDNPIAGKETVDNVKAMLADLGVATYDKNQPFDTINDDILVQVNTAEAKLFGGVVFS